MKKVLIAVDDTKGSQSVLSVFSNMVKRPEEIILLHVQRLEGKSLMIDMLGVAEMATLREQLQGTEYKENLDRQSEKILHYYKKKLEENGLITVKTVVRDGVPAEEIMKVANEEGVDLIITGSSDEQGLGRLINGCVSRDLERISKVPVLVGKSKETEDAYGLEGARNRA